MLIRFFTNTNKKELWKCLAKICITTASTTRIRRLPERSAGLIRGHDPEVERASAVVRQIKELLAENGYRLVERVKFEDIYTGRKWT